MSNNYFQFKQFRVEQNHAAMRVNTDGILLGAWCTIENSKSCLDIGSGTGLIALMMAQRSNAQIDAVEIEEGACNDAKANFIASNWSKRLSLHYISIQEYSKKYPNKYDSIVCNPPYFEDAQKSNSKEKKLARHTDTLSFEELFRCAKNLLSVKGTFSIIVPAEKESKLVKIAAKYELFARRILEIRSHTNKVATRLLIEFSSQSTFIEIDELAIYLEKTSNYTPEFKELTGAFYLNLDK